MKTIIVVYSNNKELSKEVQRLLSKYAFNTKSDVKVGDIIKSNSYDTNMQVVKVLDNSFTYYNKLTGELSNEFTSTSQNEIVEIVVNDKQSDEIVYGFKVD